MTEKIRPGKKISNVPNLRFAEFEGDWNREKIGSILTIGSGKDYKHLSKGTIPVFGTGGYMTSVNEYLYDGESVCIGRKGTINKPTYVNGKFWTVDTLFFTHSFQKVLPKFVYYVFEQVHWLKYNEASGVPSLSKSTIEQIEINIPCIEEQQKIATFLSLLDSRIQTQNKIIEHLETLIQEVRNQLFKRKKRFIDDNGNSFPEWKLFKLRDISERIVQKNSENNSNVLTISAQFGLISQLDFFNKSVSAKDISGYYLLQKNDFAYNKSYSNGYPMGAIKRLKSYDTGIVSTLYICFRFHTNVNLEFMEQYLEGGNQNLEIEKIAQEGARNHGLLNVGIKDFFNIEINLPNLQEQNRIASFLSRIDLKIQTEKAILEQLKKQKKYLLRQMFV